MIGISKFTFLAFSSLSAIAVHGQGIDGDEIESFYKTTPHCPCFNEEAVDNMINKVLGHTHTFYPGSCNKISYNDGKSTSLELYLQEVNPPSPNAWPHAIGYRAYIDDVNTEYTCTDHDAVRLIEKSQAKACVDILGKGCSTMTSNVCPCFHSQELLKSIPSLDRKKSCSISLHSKGLREQFGIYSDEGMQYGVKTCRLGKNCQRKCMIKTDLGLEFKLVNNKQYEHCTKLIEHTCLANLRLDNFSCSEQELEKFTFRDKKRRWCRWAARKNRWNRCRNELFAENCPITCKRSCPEK